MEYDEQVVRPDNRELVELQKQFVCVRILRMNDVDINFFQFDYDLTWAGMFLNADGRVYSRYGGRDAENEDGRVSVPGLRITMARVLARHKQAMAEKEPAPKALPPKYPKDVLALRGKDCVHCHQIWEGLRDHKRANGTFDPSDLHVYPLPENIGLELDLHAGNRVKKVRANSPAARARIEAGDELRRVGDVEILAQGDVTWALHNAPAQGKLTLELGSAGTTRSVELDLPARWRESDGRWRMSMEHERELQKKK